MRISFALFFFVCSSSTQSTLVVMAEARGVDCHLRPARPISPFTLDGDQENCLQSQIDSIVRRLAENEDVLRSIGALVNGGRQSKEVSGRTSVAATVELGTSATTTTSRHSQRAFAGQNRDTSLKRPEWTLPESRSRTNDSPPAVRRSTKETPATLASKKHHVQSREVVNLLAELSRRSDEVHGIRRELRLRRRQAADSASQVEEYRQRHEESEDKLAAMSAECERLRDNLMKALHDNTEVDLAAMVADSQWAVVQLKSDVASLAKKAAEAEEHYAVANKDNQRMQALINEKEECVLQGEKKLALLATELESQKGKLKRVDKDRVSASREADVWQQKCLSLGREVKRQDEVLRQQEATINGLKKHIAAQECDRDQLPADRARIAGLEQQLAVWEEKFQQLQLEKDQQVNQLQDDLETCLNSQQTKRDQWEIDRQALIASVQDSSSQVADLKAQVLEKQSRITDMEQALEAEQQQAMALRNENLQIAEEKSQLCDEVNQALEQMTGEREKWQSELLMLQRNLLRSEATVEELAAENEALKAWNSETVSHLDISQDSEALKRELSAKTREQRLLQQISCLKREADSSSLEHRNLHATLQGVTASNRDLRAALDALRAEADWKTKQLSELNAERKKLQEELTTCQLNLQRDSLERSLSQAEVERQGKVEIANLGNSLNTAQQQLLQVQTNADELKRELKKQQSALQTASKERKAAAVSLKKADADCLILREERDKLQVQVRLAREEHIQHSRQLRLNLQAAKEKVDVVEGKITDAARKGEAADKRLQQRTAQVASLQEQLKSLKKSAADQHEKLEGRENEYSKLTEKLSAASTRERNARKCTEEALAAKEQLEKQVMDCCQSLQQAFNLDHGTKKSSDALANLNSVLSEVAKCHQDLLRQAQRVSRDIPSCQGCTSRLPGMKHKLEKAQQQAIEAKRMLQMSRQMLRQLRSSAGQHAVALSDRPPLHDSL